MNIKFIDLFAGIGGFHIAMHKLGGECVFASEIDKNAQKTVMRLLLLRSNQYLYSYLKDQLAPDIDISEHKSS